MKFSPRKRRLAAALSFAAFFVLLPGLASAGEPKADSKVVSAQTPGHAVEISADITKAKRLFLVVNDGGDGFGCDWANWAEPRLIGEKGELKLTDLAWRSAKSDYGEVRKNANCKGDAMRIAGKPVEFGIGTHANSMIAFELPDGYTQFKARVGIDDAGANQGCGSTVRFLVFTERPDAQFLAASIGNVAASRDAKDAVAGLDVHPDLECTLFAAEPLMLNPTNIDIDHLGRVWVCEVVNYRRFANNSHPERKEGDRILILEDTNGDSTLDKATVFYQGRDVDSAHGICVLPTPSGKGTKAIISCGSQVFFLIDDDGDLKADRKEILFTGIEGTQHDHGIHAFVFGPDGKLYFNFGNAGRRIKDKDGKPIIDLAGNEVNDSRKPYQEGMVFRCNMDGSEFETLAWNFRNNWEVAVDSFGTMWQSDNDDDGNRGVRINYVMEFGNYGYKDELTGAGWQDQWKKAQADGASEDLRPYYHFHQFDPGVVPNLLQTGAGSPTGICVYEGDLLPEVFRNQIIHCDAGPNVVRCYPVKKSGAGYTAEIVNILVGTRDNWFRPSDVCVAPDGSLIVADWYDPGVGGHRMGDVDRGRLFRVAPPKTPYKIPNVDVSTVEGAIAALKSPNLATRYMAWTALHQMSEKAEPTLTRMLQSDPNPRFRARALWLLVHRKTLRTFDEAYPLLKMALHDRDSSVRIAGVRSLRQFDTNRKQVRTATQLKLKELPHFIVTGVLENQDVTIDPAADLRRECLLALRNLSESEKLELWPDLALRYDGGDPWYVEALGIAADGLWDKLIDAILDQETIGNDAPTDREREQANRAFRDIVWRSRSKRTPDALVKILADKSVPAGEWPRYLRSFDFQSASQEKDNALIKLAFHDFGDEAKTKLINAEAISRLKGFDVSKNEQHKAALNRILDGLKGQSQFVTLVDKFSVADRYNDLLALAATKPDDQIGIDAVRVLLSKNQQQLLMMSVLPPVKKDRPDVAKGVIGITTALSNSGDARVVPLLLPLVKTRDYPADLRRQAIKGATLNKAGAAEVLQLAQGKAFDESFTPALAAALTGSSFPEIREAALKLFPPPAGKNDKPLSPLSELAQLKGNAGNGAKLFAAESTAKCNTCHVVNGQGKDVGPNLSEIGSKLSRQALFESIIFPSAGISHNYESYVIVLTNGTTATGIMTSQDADGITIKGADAIARTYKKSEIEEMKKQEISLMPADLARQITLEELADLVEYLTTLKKK